MSSAPYVDLDDLLGPTSPDSGPSSGVAAQSAPVAQEAPATALRGILSEADFAQLIGVTTRRVRDLAKDGIVKRAGRGKYDVAQVTAYCKWISDKAKRGVAVQDDLKVERTRQARAAAEKTELHNAVTRREMVRAADVESAWASVLRDVRAAMLAIPSRVQSRIPHLTAHDVSELDLEIREALAEMAGGET